MQARFWSVVVVLFGTPLACGQSSGDTVADAASSSQGGNSAAGDGGSATATGGSTGSEGADDVNLCASHDGFITVVGTVPNFGTDVSLSFGCENSLIAPFAEVGSYLGGPGESTGSRLTMRACSEDQSLGLALVLQFGPSELAGTPGVESGTLQFSGDASSSVRLSSFTELQKPVDSWHNVTLGSDQGVGNVFAGSFVAESDVFGEPVSVTGTFSGCHVANLR